LPPIVHIGSGKVVDFEGKKSRQIDIIVYDSRFPTFEIQSGMGIYLLEGVIAIIEVKSTLTRKSLFEALDNTQSLIQLTPGLVLLLHVGCHEPKHMSMMDTPPEKP